MLSNSDHQLLVSIVNYLHSIEGDATNANLVKEALRLIQSLFVVFTNKQIIVWPWHKCRRECSEYS